MRFSVATLAFWGVAVAGIYVASRPAAVDTTALTGALTPAGTGFSRQSPSLAEKTGRLVAQAGNDGQDPAAMMLPAAAPLFAQNTVPLAAPEKQPEVPVVDESALRYFATQGDTARLEAEISRLKALYPHWTPPADPLAVKVNADARLDEMWRLYAEARYADVRRAIAERQAAEPDWTPPADLLERLKLAEARASLVAESDAGRYEAVVSIAADNAGLLTCSEVDMLWRLGEAFFKSGNPSRARDAYAYVLDTCTNAAERYATVQKAGELLPVDLLEQLLARERRGEDGLPEFEPLRDEIARRLVAAAGSDPHSVVPAQYVSRLERLAEADKKASDALLLGWYRYHRGDNEAAERWFRLAFTREESATAAEGLALALIARGAAQEAEALLYPWRGGSEGAKKAYLAAIANLLAIDPLPVLDEDILRRMAPEVISARDVEAGQQFGWYALAMRQTRTAAEWFQVTRSWRRDHEPSAYGLALALHDLGDNAGVARIQAEWAGRSLRIERLAEPVTRRREAAPSRDMETTARTAPSSPAASSTRNRARTAPAAAGTSGTRGRCWTTADPASLSPEAALARGWCLMDLDRPLEAVESFEIAYRGASRQTRADAAYGKSLAYLRAGLTARAAVAAADTAQTNARAVELQAAILSDRAVNAFARGRYREVLIALDQRARIVPEQADLLVLRAYSHLHLGRRADARRIFQALADIGNRDGLRGLADLDASH